MFTEREIEELAPLVGEYGYYGDYVYPEEFRTCGHEDEQWMPIEECSDYWISTHGRVWSSISNKFLAPSELKKNKYFAVSLPIVRHGKTKYVHKTIHRLMAKAFISNIYNEPVVRHLNDDRHDNSIQNLAWGDQADNARDCIENGGKDWCMIPVTAINIKTGESKNYKCLNDAVRDTGVFQSNAWRVLNGERRQTGGYIFRRRI